MRVEAWLDRLQGVGQTSTGWTAKCPGHADDRASLSVAARPDRVLLKCFSGCLTETIVAAMGCTMKDLFLKDEPLPAARPARRIVQTYDYTDESGVLLYQAVRYEPKDFIQRRPNPKAPGQWLYSLKGVRRVLYRLPQLQAALRQRRQPVVWVEGEKDADRLWTCDVPTTTTAGGVKGLTGLVDEFLGQLAWTGATAMILCPDHDAPGWDLMQTVATGALGIGFDVAWLELEGLVYKQDVSDWLDAGHTADEVAARLAAARSIRALTDIPPAPVPPTTSDPVSAGPRDPNDQAVNDAGYAVKDGGIWRKRLVKGGQVVYDELAPNFVAWIAEERLLDDGLHEPEKVLLIDGRMADGEACPRVAVPAAEIERLSWLAKAWPEACDLAIGQNIAAHLHRAMRRLHPDWPRRRIFTHTGWRELAPGTWVYVTAEGAVGTTDRVEVDLEPKLRSYALPTEPVDLAIAVKTSLSLWTLGPLHVTVPLWASIYRAPLCEVLPVDFLLWVEGQSGTFKSSTALLALAHFGRFQDKRDVPASWLDTATRLEQRAHAIKDALLVIDDYIRETDDAEGKATRLVRALGNATSRSRSNRDLKAQPDFPPRGLVLSTAEHRPSGVSLAARMLVIRFEPGSIDRGRLTALQRSAWRLSHAMAGYCQWLAPRLADRTWRLDQRTAFEAARDRIRDEAAATPFRVPEVLAHLWLGLEHGLAYAEAVGALDADHGTTYRETAWTALLGIRGTQTAEVEAQRETRRFLDSLLALLSTGQGRLLPQSDSGEGYSARVPLLGWANDRALLLIPDAAYGAVQGALRQAGRPLQVDLERLMRSLVEDGVALHDRDGRVRKAVKVAAKHRRVLYLIRERCAALMGDESWLGAHAPDATPDWVEEEESDLSDAAPEAKRDVY